MSFAVFLGLILACGGYAVAAGGAPERLGAGMLIGAYVLSVWMHRHFDPVAYRSAAIGLGLIDTGLFVLLIVLAWRSTRYWPLWVAGWQLASIITHLAKAIDPSMLPAGYAIETQLWAYPMVIANGLGAWRHRIRLRVGTDPAWKTTAG